MKPTHLVLATIFLILSTQPTSAQSTGSKIELGPQFTSLTLFQEFGGDVTEPGLGGRLTYNLNRKIAVEAEGNFFPNKNVFGGLVGGRAVQAHFGVKLGKRFSKFGIFGKARPGFQRGRGVYKCPRPNTISNSRAALASDFRRNGRRGFARINTDSRLEWTAN